MAMMRSNYDVNTCYACGGRVSMYNPYVEVGDNSWRERIYHAECVVVVTRGKKEEQYA